MPYSLDTAAAAERITAAGADPALARAIVTELALTDESSASKADLDALEARLTAAISASERRGILAALAIAGLLFAALRLFA